jgi:hypothetical protein
VEERDRLGHVDPLTLYILSISCRYSYSIHLLEHSLFSLFFVLAVFSPSPSLVHGRWAYRHLPISPVDEPGSGSGAGFWFMRCSLRCHTKYYYYYYAAYK